MNDTQVAIIEKTIEIVAEKGLEGFSTRQISKALGISTSNIYIYYKSKDELLYDCFLYVNKEIAEKLSEFKEPDNFEKETLSNYFRELWIEYFLFQINNDKHSLYYYAYRESNNLGRILVRNNKIVKENMNPFISKMAYIGAQLGFQDVINCDYLWVYLLDSTGALVKHIIRKNIEFGENYVDEAWKLIFGGINGYIGW